MKKDTILEVFGYLKSKQLVSGESEFSEHWLGCSEGYMRKLRHKKTVVTAHFLLRIHDISEIPIFELKKMMKDNRKFFR